MCCVRVVQEFSVISCLGLLICKMEVEIIKWEVGSRDYSLNLTGLSRKWNVIRHSLKQHCPINCESLIYIYIYIYFVNMHLKCFVRGNIDMTLHFFTHIFGMNNFYKVQKLKVSKIIFLCFLFYFWQRMRNREVWERQRHRETMFHGLQIRTPGFEVACLLMITCVPYWVSYERVPLSEL